MDVKIVGLSKISDEEPPAINSPPPNVDLVFDRIARDLFTTLFERVQMLETQIKRMEESIEHLAVFVYGRN